MRVILASKSPRRREILSMLGVKFEVLSADADEHSEEQNPATLVTELSLRKGRAVRDLLIAKGEWDEDTLIIASDTVVAAEGNILGKPENRNDAARMLRLLSGKQDSLLYFTGQVITVLEKNTFNARNVFEAEFSEKIQRFRIRSALFCRPENNSRTAVTID